MNSGNFILTTQETLEGKILEAQSKLAEAIKRKDSTMIKHWESYILTCERFLIIDQPIPPGS